MSNTVSELKVMDTLQDNDTNYIKSVINGRTRSITKNKFRLNKNKKLRFCIIVIGVALLIWFIIEYVSLLIEKKNLTNDNDLLLNELSNKANTIHEINEQIKQLAKENEELEGKTKTLKEEADKEKGEADRMQQDIQDTENKIAQIQKEIENLQAQSNELKKEIDTKKQIIQSLKGF